MGIFFNDLLNKFFNFIGSNTGTVIIYFFIVMIFIVGLEKLNFKKFKDLKTIIVSIGILGTFLGIITGLWNFKVDNISESVPTLLEGLKFAFITSVLGMFISVVLSIFENSEDAETDSIDNILKKILFQQEKMNSKDGLIYQTMVDSRKNMDKRLSAIDLSLNKALETLSEGATKQVISALEKVILDFNKNLTEQFGDNFKQLNESVKNMIIWQENYKNSIEKLEQSLTNAIATIQKTSEYIHAFGEDYQQIFETNKKFGEIMEVNQNQIQNIETHMNHLKKIGEDAGSIVISIDQFSKSIQGSLSNQSEGLNNLSKELVKQLEGSLGNLNSALTGLTGKFRNDYEQFLNLITELIKWKNEHPS